MNRQEPVVFDCLDRMAEIEISARNLPHWFQLGTAIFITFRTADSMPKEVILQWQRELLLWLKQNQLPLELAAFVIRPRTSDENRLFNSLPEPSKREFKRLSDRVWHRSLDECHGKCILRKPVLAKIVADALLHHEGTKYDLDRFIVMPNHVHAIAQFRKDADLQTVSQSWLRYTARRINAKTSDAGAFWQAEPFDHIIRSPEQFVYLQRYVAENPSKAKLQDGEFMYWERPL